MVTQPGREPLIRKAIACFHHQTYEPRQLVIVHDEPIQAGRRVGPFEECLQAEGSFARIVHAERGKSLGELRNRAIQAAEGEIVCQWDDDDQYHPDRLMRQWEAMGRAKADACFLASQLHYFAQARELYVRDTRRVGIEGTVMHRRDLPVQYPAMGKEEDSVFMQRLTKRFSATVLQNAPWLYLRVFHGSNTWDENHHRRMMRCAWDVERLRTWRGELEEALAFYDLEYPITVRAQVGRAFAVAMH